MYLSSFFKQYNINYLHQLNIMQKIALLEEASK